MKSSVFLLQGNGSGLTALAAHQAVAGHSDPRTTRLYDRRQKRVTLNLWNASRIWTIGDEDLYSAR
jgi:hypothetical protein